MKCLCKIGMLVLLFWVAYLAKARSQEAVFQAKDLDIYINQAMEKNNTPGLAIAVVDKDRIVYMKGFGFRDINGKEPITPHTLFGIGSTTKAFTCALIGMLVDEGKLSWDDKVHSHLPEFRVDDDYITQHITIRDLLTHRCGLNGEECDALWMSFTRTRDEIIHDVRSLPVRHDFRSTYSYNNVMYLAAGKIVETVTGESFEDNITERILKPLGMNESFALMHSFPPDTDVVTPYDVENDKLVPISFFDLKSIAPAGSIVSNAYDMTKWLRLHLSKGLFESKRLWKENIQDEMFTPQMLNMASQYKPADELSIIFSYGLGWFVHDYRGEKAVWHGGSIPGLYTHIGMLPNRNMGVVLFSNMTNCHVLRPLMFHVFDMYIGLDKDEHIDFQ